MSRQHLMHIFDISNLVLTLFKFIVFARQFFFCLFILIVSVAHMIFDDLMMKF